MVLPPSVVTTMILCKYCFGFVYNRKKPHPWTGVVFGCRRLSVSGMCGCGVCAYVRVYANNQSSCGVFHPSLLCGNSAGKSCMNQRNGHVMSNSQTNRGSPPPRVFATNIILAANIPYLPPKYYACCVGSTPGRVSWEKPHWTYKGRACGGGARRPEPYHERSPRPQS